MQAKLKCKIYGSLWKRKLELYAKLRLYNWNSIEIWFWQVRFLVNRNRHFTPSSPWSTKSYMGFYLNGIFKPRLTQPFNVDYKVLFKKMLYNVWLTKENLLKISISSTVLLVKIERNAASFTFMNAEFPKAFSMTSKKLIEHLKEKRCLVSLSEQFFGHEYFWRLYQWDAARIVNERVSLSYDDRTSSSHVNPRRVIWSLLND